MLTMLGSTLNSSVARTTIVAESALAPEEATICAVPGATADTMPEVLTLAIAGAVVLHDTGMFWRAPLPSVTLADNWRVAPTTTVSILGETETTRRVPRPCLLYTSDAADERS